jgi:hypothetical protein
MQALTAARIMDRPLCRVSSGDGGTSFGGGITNCRAEEPETDRQTDS